MTWFGWLFVALQVIFWACGVAKEHKPGQAALLTVIAAALVVLTLTVGTGTGV